MTPSPTSHAPIYRLRLGPQKTTQCTPGEPAASCVSLLCAQKKYIKSQKGLPQKNVCGGLNATGTWRPNLNDACRVGISLGESKLCLVGHAHKSCGPARTERGMKAWPWRSLEAFRPLHTSQKGDCVFSSACTDSTLREFCGKSFLQNIKNRNLLKAPTSERIFYGRIT